MSIGTLNNLKIYPDQFYGGFNEALAQNADAFNAASGNAIRLFSLFSRGNFREEAYFKNIANLVSRRDPTSVSGASILAVDADSMISPKVSRKIGPVAQTIDSMRKAGFDLSTESGMQALSFVIGGQAGQAVGIEHVDTALLAGTTCLGKQSSTSFSIVAAAQKLLKYSELVKLFAKFGDRAQDLQTLVMHSKPFYDLVGESVGIASDRVGGAAIYEGIAGTLGRRVVVTDSESLVVPDAGGTGIDGYRTLALRSGGIDLEQTEDQIVASEIVTGLENIVMRWQAEYAYNVRVFGYSYTNATANPDDTALGNAANWTLRLTGGQQYKWTAGAMITTL